jgi:hypothetical protein
MHEPLTLLQLPPDARPRFPRDMCCNCGAQDGLEVVRVVLTKQNFVGTSGMLGEAPYCAACKATADRVRPRLGAAFYAFGWLFAFGTALGVALIHAVVGGGVSDRVMVSGFGIGFVVALATTVLVFRWRPAVPPRTSHYQAVFLEGVGRRFLGGVDHVTVAFTNAAYAARFLEDNPQAQCAGRGD